MGNSEERLKCKDVNNFRLVDYLSSLGLTAKPIIGDYYWYRNPLTNETTPSFRVNDKINRWKDWATGETGTLIDFAIKYHRCTVGEFLEIINGNLSLQKPFVAPPPVDPNSPEELKKKVIITDVKPLYHPALLSYIKERRISQKVADRYCREVYYSLYGKERFAVGFKNDLGGYELRNLKWKGGSSPKGITTFRVPGAKGVDVFEGFFNMLSYETLFPNQERKNDLIVLNSLSFFESTRPVMESYREINLFLDNNGPGKKTVTYARSLNASYQDRSTLYMHHEDLNDFLCHFGHTQKAGKRITL